MEDRVRLYLGVFSILLVAAFVTIFELPFYIYIVSPTVLEAINMLIDDF